jgi:Ran GTPase-activating protein (RanGAP) involved in mRNA processing and transport
MDGFIAICEALKGSSVSNLSLANCILGPDAISTLANAMSDIATLNSINVMKNLIGDDGLLALMTAVKGTNIKSITGIVEGQTTIDWSGQDLTPFDMKILAADIEFTPFDAAIREMNLSANKCFGTISPPQYADDGNHSVDADQTGWAMVCKALKGDQTIETLVLSDIGAGPVALSTLADAISDMAAMNFLDVSKNSIGADGASALLNVIPDTKLQTIVIGKSVSISVSGSDPELAKMTSLDYSDQGFGLGELMIISSLVMPYTAAALNHITVDSTGSEDLRAVHLVRFAHTGPRTYTLQGLQGDADPNLDLSSKNLGPADLQFLAIVITSFSKFTAAIDQITFDGNPITGSNVKFYSTGNIASVNNVDSDLSGCEALLEALKISAVSKLSFGNCFMGPTALSTLAKFIPDIAAIREMNLSMNKCFGSKDTNPGTTTNEVVHDTDKDQTGWHAICKALKGTAIETLVLSDIGAGPVALSTLADAITDMAAIISLNAMKNPIGDKGIQVLCGALKATGIENLNLADTGMTVVGLTFLAADISKMAALSTVNLCANANINVADIEAVKIAAPNVSIEH